MELRRNCTLNKKEGAVKQQVATVIEKMEGVVRKTTAIIVFTSTKLTGRAVR